MQRNGFPPISLAAISPRANLRDPTRTVTQLLRQEMREAIASYATRAAEKMRGYMVPEKTFHLRAHDTFNNDPFYSNRASAWLSETTNDIREVVAVRRE